VRLFGRQDLAGSSFAGSGGISVSRSFVHSAGSFTPSGNVAITQASGDPVFSDTLNAASVTRSGGGGGGALTDNDAQMGQHGSTGNTNLALHVFGDQDLNAGSTSGVAIGSSGPALSQMPQVPARSMSRLRRAGWCIRTTRWTTRAAA